MDSQEIKSESEHMVNTTKQVEKTEEKSKNREYIAAVGRRKESVARVRLYQHVKEGLSWNNTPIQKGDVLVNGKMITDVYADTVRRHIYSEPLRVTNTANKYTLTIKVDGGGAAGQLEAIVHGISRALAMVEDKKYRPILKAKGFLTRDARVRQRRNVGTGGKARRKKQSPKR